ncbi:hypothetical protein MBLNU459_g5938t2 [Dothideomycetes sp. NU459]
MARLQLLPLWPPRMSLSIASCEPEVLPLCVRGIIKCSRYTDFGPHLLETDINDSDVATEFCADTVNNPALRQAVQEAYAEGMSARTVDDILLDLLSLSPNQRLFLKSTHGLYKLPRFLRWLVPFRLAIMSIPMSAKDITVLREDLHISTIVTLAEEQPLPTAWFDNELSRNIFIPVRVFHAPSFEQVDSFIEAVTNLPPSDAALVHCMAGKGRAGTFAACYLMAYVTPPYGGYPKIVREGINDDYLPLWMQAAGYNTYYTGKLWNSHNLANYDKPHVKGYNGSDFLLDPYTYDYWHAKMTRNGAEPEDYTGLYSPDVISDKASGFLNEAMQHKEPFFLTVAPIAPHSNINAALHASSMSGPAPGFSIPEYAPRHAHLFQDYRIPRGANFNPEQQSGVSWVSRLPRLNDTVVEYNDEFQRARLRSLQSVDEMVERLVKQLDENGVLDNTYVFFTTDNGFHISQWRMHPGKECGYETDVHIPLFVRGPGIAAGGSLDLVTSHTDIAPTILGIAGHTRDDFDGLAIPLTGSSSAEGRGEHVNVEFWGVGLPEGTYGVDEKADTSRYGGNYYPNNTYKALRLIGQNYSLYYSVWCTGEREFYDLKVLSSLRIG